MELVHHAGQREVERAQPENREDVRRVNDERIGRHREDRRDRVDGEDQVRELDQQQHDKQGGGVPASRFPHQEPVLAKIARDRHQALEPAHHGVPLRVDFLGTFEDHLQAGNSKESQLQLLEEAITHLNEEQRICIELFYLKKYCYQDVAEIAGFTMNEVKSFIQNGKRNLKNYMMKKNHELSD